MRLILPLHILAVVPIWVQAVVLYLLAIGVIWYLRDKQEGLAYNTAFSSQIGDVLLIGIMLMASTLLQQGTPVPVLLNTWWMQAEFATIALAVGVIWLRVDPTTHWGDQYHHIFVVPLFVYLLLNAAIIIFGGAPAVYPIVGMLLLVCWGALAVVDHMQGRIDQPAWVKSHAHLLLGFRFPP